MKKTLLLILALIGLTTLAQTAMAQHGLDIKPSLAPFTGLDTSNSTGTGLAGTAATLNVILEIIAGGLVYLAAPIAIAMLAFYGIKMKMGQENFEASKKGITWSIVGLVVIILAVVIIRTVITIIISTDNPETQKEIDSQEQQNSSTTTQPSNHAINTHKIRTWS